MTSGSELSGEKKLLVHTKLILGNKANRNAAFSEELSVRCVNPVGLSSFLSLLLLLSSFNLV